MLCMQWSPIAERLYARPSPHQLEPNPIINSHQFYLHEVHESAGSLAFLLGRRTRRTGVTHAGPRVAASELSLLDKLTHSKGNGSSHLEKRLHKTTCIDRSAAAWNQFPCLVNAFKKFSAPAHMIITEDWNYNVPKL